MATRDDVAAYIATYNGKSDQIAHTIQSLSSIASTIVVGINDDTSDGTSSYLRNHDDVDETMHFSEDFFSHESTVRKRIYDLTLDVHGDPQYVISPDDDEIILNDKILRSMLKRDPAFIYSRHLHLWTEDKYRVDHPWESVRVIGVDRHRFDSIEWTGREEHSGRIPMPEGEFDVDRVATAVTAHFGWYMNDDDRRNKMRKKIERDRERWENAFIADISETQLDMYRSFMDEPELEELRPKYADKLSDVECFPTSF